MKRQDATQLPQGSSELTAILLRDERRKLPVAKKDLHSIDFSTIQKLLTYYNLPADIFKLRTLNPDISIDGLLEDPDRITLGKVGKVLEEGARLVDELAAQMVKDSTPPVPIFNQIFEYLSEEDNLNESDLIFVFGSKDLERLETAVAIFKKGYAPKIMFSGGSPIYHLRSPEALIYQQEALQRGIPKDAILTEAKSVSLAGNVLASLNLLERKKIQPRSLILVCSPYAMRRAYGHMLKYTLPGTGLTRINCPPLEYLSHRHWYKSERGIKTVLNEFFKMLSSKLLNTL